MTSVSFDDRLQLVPRAAHHPYLYSKRLDSLLMRSLPSARWTNAQNSLDDLRFNGVPREAFESWCGELGVNRLKTVPRQWQ